VKPHSLPFWHTPPRFDNYCPHPRPPADTRDKPVVARDPRRPNNTKQKQHMRELRLRLDSHLNSSIYIQIDNNLYSHRFIHSKIDTYFIPSCDLPKETLFRPNPNERALHRAESQRECLVKSVLSRRLCKVGKRAPVKS